MIRMGSRVKRKSDGATGTVTNWSPPRFRCLVPEVNPNVYVAFDGAEEQSVRVPLLALEEVKP